MSITFPLPNSDTSAPVTNWQSGQTVMPADMNNLGQSVADLQEAANQLNTGLTATESTLNAHVGAGGTAHAAVTEAVNGFMSAADKATFDGWVSAWGGPGLGGNGYQRFPSGLILQWGQAPAGEGNLNFPIPFPSAAFLIVASSAGGQSIGAYIVSASQFALVFDGSATCSWIAVGH